MARSSPKILFVLNPGAGNSNTDWKKEIADQFPPEEIEIFDMPNPCSNDQIEKLIRDRKPEKVVAVGGDGTVKLLAEILYKTDIPLGILPGGSANGMARELKIENSPASAIEVIKKGRVVKIHLVKINDELCIHLSDIGFNAFVVKKFETTKTRGMWGYVKAAWKVLWKHSPKIVSIRFNGETISIRAEMVVIANATCYGNGVVINPKGCLTDNLFEIVVVKKLSFTEIFKMRFSKKDFDDEKTVVYQTSKVEINSVGKVHFQIDGEYKGKINKVQAEILPDAISIIVPENF